VQLNCAALVSDAEAGLTKQAADLEAMAKLLA